MIWWFYNIIFTVVYLALLPRFLLRMWKRGGYLPSFSQRFGIYDKSTREKLASMPARFLIHAVSVGEIQVALRFMAEMRIKRPGSAFVLTTTTSTAHALAEKQIKDEDVLLYFPVDFPFIVKRVLRQIKPQGLILVESELWPNLVRFSSAQHLPIMLLNARISNRSFRRYQFVRPLVRRILMLFTRFCAQSEEDARRLIVLGADAGRVQVTGSAKYDIANKPCRVESSFLKSLQALGFDERTLLLVAGSTWPGEEKTLLKIYTRLCRPYPHLRLVLVPRHAERRKQVKTEIEQSGLSFSLWSECRSQAATPKDTSSVLLVDTTGDLKAFYAVATAVFIGKSLTARGGQNPIEAAVCSKPIVMGPHMENFSGIMADFTKADALIQVGDEQALEKAIHALLADENARRLIGERAYQTVLGKSGALRASVNVFLNCLAGS